MDILQFGCHNVQQSRLLTAIFLMICLQNMAFILAAQGIPSNVCLCVCVCILVSVHMYSVYVCVCICKGLH